MQVSGLEGYSSLRQWAGIPAIPAEIVERNGSVEGYQNVGQYEETGGMTKRTFSLWRKKECCCLAKWVRVAAMIIATATVIIPIIVFFLSLESAYVNTLCPDRIFKKEIALPRTPLHPVLAPPPQPSESLLVASSSSPSQLQESTENERSFTESARRAQVASAEGTIAPFMKAEASSSMAEGTIAPLVKGNDSSTSIASFSIPLQLQESTENERPFTESDMKAEVFSMAKEITSSWVRGNDTSRGKWTVTKKNEYNDHLAHEMSRLLEEQLRKEYPSFKMTYHYDAFEHVHKSCRPKPCYVFEASLEYTPGTFNKTAVLETRALLPKIRKPLAKTGEATVVLFTGNQKLGEEIAQLLQQELVQRYPSVKVQDQYSPSEFYGGRNGTTSDHIAFTVTALEPLRAKTGALLIEIRNQLRERGRATVELLTSGKKIGNEVAELLKQELLADYPSIQIQHQQSVSGYYGPNTPPTPEGITFKVTI